MFTGHLRTVVYVKTLNEVLFVELWLFVCFVFRLAATKGIRISRREYLKVNVRRTWSEKSLFLIQNIAISKWMIMCGILSFWCFFVLFVIILKY